MFTRYEWLSVLESMSLTIASFDIRSSLSDDVYKISRGKSFNKDAFNFANSDAHSRVVADTVEQLAAKGTPPPALKKLTTDLLGGNMYGAFCEFAVYSELLRGGQDFEVQVHIDGIDILNPNGSDLDGLLTLAGQRVFFDVKAFGFTEHLRERLLEKLREEFPTEQVATDGSFDVSVSTFQQLLGRDFKPLVEELRTNRSAQRETIEIKLKPLARIQVSQLVSNPHTLIEANKDYAFRFAKQFVRNEPFVLFFVIHPWVSTLRLHLNFAGSVEGLLNLFASKTFNDFRSDQAPTFGTTRAVASGLLAGIVFVDAWFEDSPQRVKPYFRAFLNPHATNPLTDAAIDALVAPYGDEMRLVRHK